MKKIIGLIMCAVMLFGFIPKLTIAAETTQKQAVKIGVEKGDIVSFAGADNMPIRWRVINAAQSNAGNANGMLLLGEDTAEEVADNSMEYSVSRLNNVYKSFYDKYFAQFCRNAVMPTTLKTSSPVYGYSDELKDDTVFSLSRSEAEKMSVGGIKFKDKKWLLRTVRKYRDVTTPKYEFTYVDANGNVKSAEIGNENKTGYYFRPAVNIDKTKLAQLDGKPLLLPGGEYGEADNKLAVIGSASEWKLTQKDNSVTITSAAFSEKDNNEYEITVGTDLENPDGDGDDYISLIIKRSDGSVSHYGRYAMTAAEKTFSFTLPEDYNNAYDSVYVFYENYKGALSGSAGEITEICLHDYSCVSVDDKMHRYTCKRCGHSYDEEHKYAAADYYEDKAVSCLNCNRQESFMVKRVGFNTEPVFAGKTASVRTEYDRSSLQFSNCDTNEYKDYFFDNTYTYKSLNFIPKGERAVVTFQTTTPIRATGFRIVPNYYAVTSIPSNIILYGKKGNSGDDYKKIGSAFLRPFKPKSMDSAHNTFAFLFTDQTNFAAYDSFKLEMDSKSGDEYKCDTIMLYYFGLLSDQGSSFSVSADGVAVDGEEPVKVYPDEDLSLTLTSKNGHPSSEGISLFINDEQVTEKIYEYSENTGVFKLSGDKIENGKNYVLKAVCSDKSINVDFELNRAKIKEKTQAAEYGKDFLCIFTDANGKEDYAPGKWDIKVLCGEKDITANCTFSYGIFTIPAKYVTGNLKIIANEKNCIQKQTSTIKIEKKGEQTRWYDSLSDAQLNYVVDTKGNSGVLIAAVYSADGLIGVTQKSHKGNTANKLRYALPELSEIAKAENMSKIKLMLWNSFDGMVPLTDVAIISYVKPK